MSILGVSTISDEVAEAMVYGGKHFVEMASLHKEAGKLVANHTNHEAAFVTNSASASIALAIAGLIVKDKAYYINHLYDASAPLKREILIMCGHKVDYGAPVEVMMRLGGATPKDVGYANGCSIKQIEQAISEQTAGMLFIQSHHCVQKNMPSLEEVSHLCKKHGVPLIVDAAAEESIDGFSQLADMVIFSGSKAIQGPTSGILAGKRQFITYAAMHNEGIGRSMKVGKESIFGLLKALETYDHAQMTKEEQLEILKQLEQLESIPGVAVSIQADESGRDIYRGRIHVHTRKANRTALELVEGLIANDPAIYTRDYHANEGHIDIDPRSLKSKEIKMIVQTITDIMEG